MLQRDGRGSVEEKISSVFKPPTCMFPVRTLEAGEAAAGAGSWPLLQTSILSCWDKAVKGGGRKDREVVAAGSGEASKKWLEGCA